jgi:uncharacterized membrane protein YoaK (UPF0700 family)
VGAREAEQLSARQLAAALETFMREKTLALVWLSVTSGCTDVLSFLKFGDVFTSAMTGNTALLAIAIGRGHLLAALHSVTALLGFTLGVAAAVQNLQDTEQNPRLKLRRLLLVEIASLAGCAALWSARGASPEGVILYAIILLSAVGMGIQGVAARIIDSRGISTIVFTSVLISIMTSLAGGSARRSTPFAPVTGIRGHLGAFAAYSLGALLAALLVAECVELLVWIPMIAVTLALGCLHVSGDTQRRVP